MYTYNSPGALREPVNSCLMDCETYFTTLQRMTSWQRWTGHLCSTSQTQICQTWKLLLFHRVTSFIILKIVSLFGNAQLLKKIKKLTNRVLRVPPAFHISNWANLATAAVTGGKPNQHSPRHQNYLQILTTCIQPWSDHHRQQISTNTVRHK